MISTPISEAKAKSHILELIAKSLHSHERFIITRKNKPVAALVGLKDLKTLEQYEKKQGLASIAGQWQDFDEVIDTIGDIKTLRANVSKEQNITK